MSANNGRREPTLAGLPMKYISLVTLTFQNSGLILVMHYSRIMPLVDGKQYYISTAVLLNEVIKLIISLLMAVYEMFTKDEQATSTPGSISELSRAVFSGDSWKLAIPAMLYTLQNSLQYVAVSNLNAATYQVLSQLKILTTAVFSVILLSRSLSGRKWFALLVLMLGVGIVQIPVDDLKVWFPNFFPNADEVKRSLVHVLMLRDSSQTLQQRAEEGQAMNSTVGLIAVAIGATLSGLAGVYFEKVLKDPKSSSSAQASLWVRNIQLSFYSLFPALFIGVMIKDGELIRANGFFYGYNSVTWAAIMFQATGGILVALVVKFADNIAKNFATSFSIIVSFLVSVWVFNFKITVFWIFGTVLVIGATFLFNTTPASKSTQPVVIDLENQKEAEAESANEPLLSSTDSSDVQELKVQPSRPAVLPDAQDSQAKREA